MSRYVFKMPDLGEGTVSAEVVAWHVKPGDLVQEDQVMCEVMTEKAAVEMPAKGRMRKGSRAVTVSGTASVIHHAAIHQVSPATVQASGGMDPGAGKISVTTNPDRPSQKPIRLAVIACIPSPAPATLPL